MSYCTLSNILNSISEEQLAKLTNDVDDTVDVNVINEKIAAADSEIDSYLRKHYSVPLATAPDIIRDASVVISLFKTYSRRPNIGMPDTVKDNYEKVIAWLKLVAKKEVMLPIEPQPTSTTSEPIIVKTPERQFTRDSLKKF